MIQMFHTLIFVGKVKLFRNCEPGLLKDLVVLLRSVICKYLYAITISIDQEFNVS